MNRSAWTIRTARLGLFSLLSLRLSAGSAETLKIQRVGKVVDAQGICALQPKLQERWTPLSEGAMLNPGDWLRTDPRGANALQVRLGSSGKFILGPGGLVEALGDREIRLVRGELEMAPAEKVDLALQLPGGKTQRIAATSLFRVQDDQITELKQEPNWLKAFKGAVTAESMGALLAKVDGRDMPLTLGYHKVTVDIRDQIARTVIEESFVNHTSGTLEGVFHFPLPQDASISGFGMWIGNELVEADVVEKQRAREIYETILRERRDPGLLEWAGGNIFKARVFPIFGHSEKRIKITYTQVLPMQGGRYRYSYALQSEMLKQHPLRELAVNVRLHSALPLKSVACPTHEARISRTAQSAQVEFAAQEYTPSRDFEVEIETDARGREAVLVPHRRGDDGYFLLLVSPPDAGGDWQRTLIPDGPPLDVILAADTSASMDRGQREAQDQFIGALLGSLGARDRCRLAAADVDGAWFRNGEPFAATEKEISAAREFLAARPSLGWTDMERTLSNVLARATAGTLIVYVGDGIGTTGDADPVRIAQSLKRLHEGVGTVHAVATGSSFEPGILKALAGMGGGSFRRIEGRNGPQTAAMALLGEIAQPVIRDLAIEFKGLRAARVYPEVLPNVCAGQQQIVLGRYLPEGRNQSGEVVVSGTRDGKPVRFKAAVALKDAESGNEFIPRLWARLHLDALLEQGQTQTIKDEIIALSEDYHLMTPYTSFLVLESDEDRERFKVKRRFTMRDGERFFAEGRDAATLELRQKQILAAGQWRQDLRRDTLRELLDMGRDPASWQSLVLWSGDRDGEAFPVSGVIRRYGMSGGRMGMGGAGSRSEATELNDRTDSSRVYAYGGGKGRGNTRKGGFAGYDGDESGAAGDDLDDIFKGEKELGAPGQPVNEPMAEVEPKKDSLAAMLPRLEGGTRGDEYKPVPRDFRERRVYGLYSRAPNARGRVSDFDAIDSRPRAARYAPAYYSDSSYSFSSVLPLLAPAPADIVAQPGQPPWPEDVRRIADSLLRQPVLDAMKGGVEIDLTHNAMTRPARTLSFQCRLTMLYSPRKWVSRFASDMSRRLTEWAYGDTRGVLCQAMQLGRQRQAQKTDLGLQLPGFGYFNDYSLVPLAPSFQGQSAGLKTNAQGQVTITFRYLTNPSYEQRILIDPRRHVLLRQEAWSEGKIMSQTAFEGFVEAAGCWWATRVTTTGGDGRITGVTTVTVKEVAAEDFEKQYGAALPDTDRAIVLRDPMPDLAAARQADFEKRARFEHLLTLIGDHSRKQQWDQVNNLWQRAETLAKGQPGVEWMADVILEMTRRNDELAKRCFERATRLVAEKPPDDLFLAMSIKARADRVMQVNERLALHEALRPVYDRQPARLRSGVAWRQAQAQLLRQAGRNDEARRAWESLAKECPEDTSIQTQYVNAMAEAGELPAAFQWIKTLLARPDLWTKAERDSVRDSVASQVHHRVPEAEWLAFLEEWMADSPAFYNVHDNYLSALIRLHQTEKANATIKQWMEEGLAGQKTEVRDQRPEIRGQKSEAEQARIVRLGAAVRMTLGQENYYGSYSGRKQYDERWSPLLAKVVTGTYRSPTLYGLANQIMQHDAFRQTKEAADLRREFVDVLIEDAGALGGQHVSHLVSWLMASDPALKDETWQAIGRTVIARWATEPESPARQQIAQTVLQILRRSGAKGEVLAFLHRQVKEGPAEYRDTYARQLFDELRAQPWNVEFEDECFSLLGRLSSATNTADRLPTAVPALYDLVDAMQEGRYQAALDAVPKKEELSRTEFQSLQRQKRSDARAGLIQRLANEAGRQDAALAPWLTIERLALAVRLKQDPRALAAECRELLGPEPAADGEQTPLQWHLADRALTTLACLAAMQPRDETLAQPLIAFLDKGIARNPDSPYWRYQKYRILVALDRPADLEKALTAWVEPAKADTTWRVALGYLMAEQDRVQDAIRQFEAGKATDGLGPQDLRSLADWYLALGQKGRYGDARIEALMAEEEYGLSERLSPILRPWHERREAPPPELDPETFNIFKALFRKAQQPLNYVHRLREFYRYTRDFRLLECLAEGILGHSAQQAYPFVHDLQDLLNEVRDEATVDSIVRHLDKVRERARTRVDRRALDFLELQAERRAADVANQPGPHAGKALGAMKRVFKGDWDAGERRLMADLLAGLGRIKGEELGREQLRHLAELHACREQPAEDRLQIALRLAETLWVYERRDEALDTLEAALAEFREVNKGTLPATANTAFGRFLGYLRDARHFARAEQAVRAELTRPANVQQTYWLKQRLFEVYTGAIGYSGSVSLGTGQALYAAVQKLFLAELNTDDPGHRNQLIEILCSFFRAARDAKLELAGLREFAFQTFPKFLERETNPDTYHQASERLADTLHDLLGVQTGLEFLIERFEDEPEWMRASYQSAWHRHYYRLARWREEVKDPGKLADRMLRIVTNELRRDLRSRNYPNRCIYHRHSNFWAEKATNFLAVANEIWAEQHPSGAAAKYIADYLRSGLNETARAIEMLAEALKADQLDEQGLSQLAQYQHELERFEDSIPVLTRLVALRKTETDNTWLVVPFPGVTVSHD